MRERERGKGHFYACVWAHCVCGGTFFFLTVSPLSLSGCILSLPQAVSLVSPSDCPSLAVRLALRLPSPIGTEIAARADPKFKEQLSESRRLRITQARAGPGRLG